MDDMISGLYSAATALDAAETRHRVASENLAHVHQPGYRRRIIQQATFTSELSKVQDPSGYAKTLGTSITETDIHVDHSSGVLDQSERPLDVAIQGDGFFAVDGPEGPLFTRNGRFHVSGEGTLITIDGLPVRGKGGPITIPVEGGGASGLQIDQGGRVIVNGQEVGQLELTRFEEPQELLTAGASLFEDPGTAGAQEAQVQVLQGYVERSNVTPIDELVSIMLSSRQYEAARKALTSIDETIQKRIDLN
jgi:flagellar basal-body rod protein FlgF